jgi:carboxyl-terminal processing protease
MDARKRKRCLLFFTVSGIAVGIVIASLLGCRLLDLSVPSDKIPPDAKKNFGLMAEAWNAIHSHYVDRAAVKPKVMTYGAISGMVAALGDTGHSTFLSPEMIKEEEEYTKGQYKGIGAEVKMKEGHVVIVAPMDNSPAQKAGLKPGQIIIAVDGKDVAGLSLIQVVKKISGPEGTKVTLRIFSPKTGLTRDITLVRASITVNNVTWCQVPGTKVAHLRIAGFSEGVTGDLKEALKKIENQGLQGLILDLRNDPGGLLREAVSTASQFLSGGIVLEEKDVKGHITPVPVEKGGTAIHIPVVGLINGGTASAAEIVAGALQDRRRAVLVGTTTFGTGTVLEEFPLSDGSALLLAVQEWLTPDGHTIWHKGITPNSSIALPEGVAPVFPLDELDMTPRQLRQSRDDQLLRALDLLTGRTG